MVLGIDGDRVALWTVRLQAPREAGGSKTLYSRLSGIQPLDSGVPRITSSVVCTPLSALFNLVTGHEDGTIRFWRLQLAVRPPPFLHFLAVKALCDDLIIIVIITRESSWRRMSLCRLLPGATR